MTKDNQKSSLQAIILVVAVFYSVKQAKSAAIANPIINNDTEELMVNIYSVSILNNIALLNKVQNLKILLLLKTTTLVNSFYGLKYMD